MPAELPTDYYLTNFCELITFVSESYADLLTERECQYAQRLLALPQPALRLYIRLLCRSKSLFRLDKLKYPEIDCLQTAAEQLQAARLLLIDPTLEVETALTLLTKSDVLVVLKKKGMTAKQGQSTLSSMKRAEIDQIALQEISDSAQLLDGLTLFESQDEELFDVYKLCFFGNLYQDMTDYVLRDLGLAQYESYSLDSASRAFRCRDQIQQHLDYYRCVQQLELVVDQSPQALLDIASVLPCSPHSSTLDVMDATLLRRVDRLRNRIARQLERQGHFESALELFKQSSRPPARERRARILARLGQNEESLDLCRQVCQAPRSEEELQIVSVFAARLAKRQAIDWPAVESYKPQQETLILENSGESVEMIARDYFARQSQCFYTENVLCNSVFGLAFWDIIFSPVPGAFFNPFQNAPADFYEVEFQRSRQEIIEQRLVHIADTDAFRGLVHDQFKAKSALQNPMVNWRYLSAELLEIALLRIPVEHWIGIFKRLLEDLRTHRNGFPDLVVFPHTGGYEFVEIKGPGDTLQKNQLRWMACFDRLGIRHQVCHIAWPVV